MLINEGQGFVVWEKGSPRPVVSIFYFSHKDLKQKNSLDLILGNGLDSILEESLEKIKQTRPKGEYCRGCAGAGGPRGAIPR